MHESEKYKTIRSHPSQERGKERVRIILAAALKLITAKGFEEVTTNDIAKAANIPIGSLYRYYPNKDAIVQALIELYTSDLAKIFADIARLPVYKQLSWDEILLLLVDSWVSYSRLNGPFPLLYAEKANPRLHALDKKIWIAFVDAFQAVIRKRCPEVTDQELQLCFQFCLKAAEMGISDEYRTVGGPTPHYEAVKIIAAYMDRICDEHNHQS